MFRLRKPTRENALGVLVFGAIAVGYGAYLNRWSEEKFWHSLSESVLVPCVLTICAVFAWHLFRSACCIYNEERRPFINAFGASCNIPPSRVRVELYILTIICLLMPVTLAYAVLQNSWAKPTQPWCYAFVTHVWPWTRVNQLVSLYVLDPTKADAHNVEVNVQLTSRTNLGDPRESMERDLEMYRNRGTILPLVRSFLKGEYQSTGLTYQDYPPNSIFQITLTPEDGDQVVEKLDWYAVDQCVVSVTRVRDGKVLLKNVRPPFDMVTGRYRGGLSTCWK